MSSLSEAYERKAKLLTSQISALTPLLKSCTGGELRCLKNRIRNIQRMANEYHQLAKILKRHDI